MLHPMFSLLMNRPDLVADHLAGYAVLAGEEAADAGQAWLGRALAWLMTVVLAAVFLALAGGAVMLGTLHSFHWTLVAVPAAAGVLALVAWTLARRPVAARAFGELRQQLNTDLVAFRRAGQAGSSDHGPV